MQRSSSTSACASCKHQRKKCVDSCLLAPFFPVGKTREFQAVQKVFGVSNITKIVKNLREEDRKRAVDSLIWEALCRLKDPVLGPYGEYRKVCEELRLYKSQYQQYLQVTAQGNIAYKGAAQGQMGWGNGKALNSNGGFNAVSNSTNNFHSNGSSVVEFCSHHHVPEAGTSVMAESDNGSALILPQPHLAIGFNQKYFLAAGQYKPMDSTAVESIIKEGS